MHSLKIKIFTRSANIELYSYSKKLTGKKFPKVRLCNTTADGYFYEMLSDQDCDIAINIDEDAFLVNEEAPYLLRIKDQYGEDHYEETNSVGPLGAETIANTFEQLLSEMQ